MGAKNKGPRVNDAIRAPEVRLIDGNNEQRGVVSLAEAMEIAQEQGLDLVEVSPNANPPVVKCIDYGKFKYMQQKKANEAKKKQAVVVIKEIQFRPNIETHDLEVKMKRAERFLADGDKLKLVMQFRGREMAYQAAGLEKFKGIIADICEKYDGVVESEPKIMGNRIFSMVAPSKKGKK